MSSSAVGRFGAILNLTMVRRLVAASLALTLFGAWMPPCAGWESAQARHDCCAAGMCPNQIKAAEHSGHTSGHSNGMPKDVAHRCCATSEHQQQQRTAQLASETFLPAPSIELVFVIPAETIAAPHQPDTGPIPIRPARLHLLFSVFLV